MVVPWGKDESYRRWSAHPKHRHKSPPNVWHMQANTSLILVIPTSLLHCPRVSLLHCLRLHIRPLLHSTCCGLVGGIWPLAQCVDVFFVYHSEDTVKCCVWDLWQLQQRHDDMVLVCHCELIWWWPDYSQLMPADQSQGQALPTPKPQSHNAKPCDIRCSAWNSCSLSTVSYIHSVIASLVNYAIIINTQSLTDKFYHIQNPI